MPTIRGEQHAETVTLENAYLGATVHGNGTVDLRNKQSGIEYHGLLCYKDDGDLGDTYRCYCSPSKDQFVVSADAESTTLEVIEPGPLLCRCRNPQVMRLPAGANSLRNGRDATTVEVPVVTELTLAATDTALQARAFVFETAREPDPITTPPFRSFVAAQGAVCELAILTRGLYKYEYTTGSAAARPALQLDSATVSKQGVRLRAPTLGAPTLSENHDAITLRVHNPSPSPLTVFNPSPTHSGVSRLPRNADQPRRGTRAVSADSGQCAHT